MKVSVNKSRRSASMALRTKAAVKGIVHGRVRLLEHDKIATTSSNATEYRAKFSLLDDPTLEINQLD